jgi:DNA-binding beta-propeller fold protein YncE
MRLAQRILLCGGRVFALACHAIFILLAFEPSRILAAGLSFQPGDVVVNSLNRIIHYRADGTEVFRFDGAETDFRVFEGAAILPSRRIATTRRLPTSGLVIIEAGGITSFDTPAVGIPGDVSVFDDGTFAISDQAGDIDLYSPSGSFVASIAHTGLSAGTPFGNAIGPDNTLWVAAFGDEILRFSRTGQFLGSVPVGFSTRDIAVDHVDGTLWIPSADGVVHQFDASGVELFSFPTVATPPFVYPIAMGPDRTLYVSSLDSTRVHHYDRTGMLLDSFIHNNGRPAFINVAFIPEPSTVGLGISLLVCLLSRVRQFSQVTPQPN